MAFQDIDTMPTLVRLANADYKATQLVLEYILKEHINNQGNSTLLCLSYECGDCKFAYKQIGVHEFLRQLLVYDKPYNEIILNTRLTNAYIPIGKFRRYKLRALVLFKHFQREFRKERERIEEEIDNIYC